MKASKIHSKTVLITGCSSGIGECVANCLREVGWDVFPTSRSESDVKKLYAKGFEALQLDLSDSISIENCVSNFMRKSPLGIGAIVNNAGIAIPGAVEDLSRDDLRAQFEVNVFGLQELTNKLVPTFRDQGWGRIVNISSIYGILTAPMVGGYCASKYALEALSNAQRMELSNSGITLSLVEPGPILSSFRRNAYESLSKKISVGDHFYSDYKKTLDRKLGKSQKNTLFTLGPKHVANKVVHALTSDHPKRRYLITYPAYAGYVMARILPDFAVDYFMKKSVNF
jgi:short-subunit dehydrogenase|tara:strand:- start:376 stop:1227 length:852 start_codon:yes stop_codon:yes gene_type:complete